MIGVQFADWKAEEDFRAMDENDGGYVLFDEFCRWCAERHMKTNSSEHTDEENDDDDSDDEMRIHSTLSRESPRRAQRQPQVSSSNLSFACDLEIFF